MLHRSLTLDFPDRSMPVILSRENNVFPPARMSDEEGLLAIGGDLSVPRLIAAYRHGIFPWYEKAPILWWCPDPRFVLFPERIRISHSMQKVLERGFFHITVNKAFDEVIRHCSSIIRKGQQGTWLNEEMIEAYKMMHRQGWAHSVEAWQGGRLAGGLYGIRMGKVFFGESMFSFQSNASKAAFITYVQQLKEEGCRLVDCQVYSGHLASLGAEMIPRDEFLSLLDGLIV